jgi:hypothetical protein
LSFSLKSKNHFKSFYLLDYLKLRRYISTTCRKRSLINGTEVKRASLLAEGLTVRIARAFTSGRAVRAFFLDDLSRPNAGVASQLIKLQSIRGRALTYRVLTFPAYGLASTQLFLITLENPPLSAWSIDDDDWPCVYHLSRLSDLRFLTRVRVSSSSLA